MQKQQQQQQQFKILNFGKLRLNFLTVVDL